MKITNLLGNDQPTTQRSDTQLRNEAVDTERIREGINASQRVGKCSYVNAISVIFTEQNGSQDLMHLSFVRQRCPLPQYPLTERKANISKHHLVQESEYRVVLSLIVLYPISPMCRLHRLPTLLLWAIARRIKCICLNEAIKRNSLMPVASWTMFK
jgi:hypothetical protein